MSTPLKVRDGSTLPQPNNNQKNIIKSNSTPSKSTTPSKSSTAKSSTFSVSTPSKSSTPKIGMKSKSIYDNKENQTENIGVLIKKAKIQNNDRKRKSMGVSFADTVEIRVFEKMESTLSTKKNQSKRHSTATTKDSSPKQNQQPTQQQIEKQKQQEEEEEKLQKIQQIQQQLQLNNNKPRSSPFGNGDDDEDEGEDEDEGGQTMEFTAVFPGRIYVPYICDEVQPLKQGSVLESGNGEDQYMADMSQCSMDVSVITENNEFIAQSPAHKSTKRFAEQTPRSDTIVNASNGVDSQPQPLQSLLSLAAEDEDFGVGVFKKPMTPTKSPKKALTSSSDSNDSGGGSPIPTLTDLYEEDMTGNFKEIVAKLDSVSNTSTIEIEDENTTVDLTTQFHIQNGTQGSGGRLLSVLDDTTMEFNLQQQQQQQERNQHQQEEEYEQQEHQQFFDNSEDNTNSESNNGDMSFTQALGNIVQLSKEQTAQQSQPNYNSESIVNQSMNQSVNQSINQSVNQSINQSMIDNEDKDMTITRSFGEILMLTKKRMSLKNNNNNSNNNSTIISKWDINDDVTNNLKCLTTPTKTIVIDRSKLLIEPPAIPITSNDEQPQVQPTNTTTLAYNQPFFQSTTSQLAESMITKTQTNSDFQHLKQYTCTPSFTNYEAEDSFVYGKINFNRSNIGTDQKMMNSIRPSTTITTPIIDNNNNNNNFLVPSIPKPTNSSIEQTSNKQQDKSIPLLSRYDNEFEGSLYNMVGVKQDPNISQIRQSSMMIEDLMSLRETTSNAIKKITFNDFLYLANCRFLDDHSSKAKRPSLVGMLINTDDAETDFRSQLIAAYCHNRQNTAFRAGYDQLKSMIASINDFNRQAEEEMNQRNPPIFALIQRSTKDDLISKQHLLKKIKNSTKLSTQVTYIQWRSELERKVGNELLQSKQQLLTDLETLGDRIKEIQESEIEMLNEFQCLKNQHYQLDVQRQKLAEKIANKTNATDQKLVNALADEQKRVAQLIDVSQWTVQQCHSHSIAVEHCSQLIKYSVNFRLSPTNANVVAGATMSMSPLVLQNNPLAKLELELVKKLCLDKLVLSKITTAKSIRESLNTLSVSIGRIERLCQELRQLETLYNVRVIPFSSAPLSSTSQGYSYQVESKSIMLEIQLSNSKLLRKLLLRMQVPISYPSGNIEYTFKSLIGKTDEKEISEIINYNCFGNQRRSKLTKVIQSLNSFLSE